jgi:hypothetical protein
MVNRTAAILAICDPMTTISVNTMTLLLKLLRQLGNRRLQQYSAAR